LFLFGLCFRVWGDSASIMDVFRCVETSRSRKKNEQVCSSVRPSAVVRLYALSKFDRLSHSIAGPYVLSLSGLILTRTMGLSFLRRLLGKVRAELFPPVSMQTPFRRRRATQRGVAPEVRSRVVTSSSRPSKKLNFSPRPLARGPEEVEAESPPKKDGIS